MACDPKILAAKLNEAENALGRAMRAATKSDFVRAWNETTSAIALATEAKAMCHDDVPHEHPAPSPSPTPTPAPAPAPTPAPAPAPTPTPTPTPEPTPTPTPAPTPSPTPTPAPAPTSRIHLTPPTPLIFTQEDIERFTRADVWNIPAATPADQAAFRFFGNWTGELNYDDALLYPGQPGRAHLHIYTGLPGVNAFSTLDSMLQTEKTFWVGNETMRPAVWHPAALLDGQVKIHDHVLVYYKHRAMDECLPALPDPVDRVAREAMIMERTAIVMARDGLDRGKARQVAYLELCREYHTANGTIYGPENIPLGMCMIGGHKMDATRGNADYLLIVNNVQFVAPTITEAFAKWEAAGGAGDVPAGSMLLERHGLPHYWNGELGSSDYRSHVSFGNRGALTEYMPMPPATHPRSIMHVTVQRRFTQRAGEPPMNRLRLSSDAEGMQAGATSHVDYISLWPEWSRNSIWQNIIEKHLSTSTSGNACNYGNGRTAVNPGHTLDGWKGHPRFVPIPENHFADGHSH